ncbi:CBO0543 family protein [Neobacillus sp. Marseille-QA0830]
MNTVKHLNGSKLRHLPKRPLTFLNKHVLSTALMAILLGTYLDLYYVGKGLYYFPYRPFPEIFPINILFNLLILPVFIIIFLFLTSQINGWGKAGMIIFVSLLMPTMERLAEQLGWFVHSVDWRHLYTFFGYVIFLTLSTTFHSWIGERSG